MARNILIFIFIIYNISISYGQHISPAIVHSGVRYIPKPLKTNISAELQKLYKLPSHISFTLLDKNKFQLYYHNYKVEDAVLTVNNNSISGLVYNFEIPNNALLVDASAAFNEIKHELDLDTSVHRELYVGTPESLIYVKEIENEHYANLAYKLHVRSQRIGYNSFVYIDAITGSLIEERSNICHNDVAVFAKSLYQGNVILNVSRNDDRYSMESARVPIRTFDLDGQTEYNTSQMITGELDLFVTQTSAVQAHYTAQQTYLYYLYRHNRDSYDGIGGTLNSYINYDNDYTNAFWDGDRMVYGAGDSIRYAPLIALDITGHELTHGVIDHSADLIYSKESGALNESFADIFGEMVEFFATGNNDWIVGSESGLVDILPFRSMIDPKNNDDPDTYGGIYWVNPECETPRRSNDYCGVHNNSGVQNKWFYILAMGETGTNDLNDDYHVVGINRNAAAAIAYRNLTTYLWPTSNFMDARNGSIQAAIDLYGEGSTQEISTTNAWFAVGVGEPYVELDSTEVVDFHIYPEVLDVTTHSINLSWFTDIRQDSLIYQVYLDSNKIATTLDTIWLIESLDPGRSYDIFIEAVIGEEVLSKSTTVNVLTLDNPVEKNLVDTVFASYFEKGLDGWSPTGSNARWYVGHRSPEGAGSVQLRKDAITGTIESPEISLEINKDYTLEFSLYTWSMETNEKLIVEQYIEQEWIELANYSSMVDFFNYNIINHQVKLMRTDSSSKVRFSIEASAMTDHIYIDEIVLTAQDKEIQSFTPIDNTFIWPNPSSTYLHVERSIVLDRITIVNTKGETIISIVPNAMSTVLDIREFSNGLYHILIENDGNIESHSFIKS